MRRKLFKKSLRSIMLCALGLTGSMVHAQSYTYEWESFEDAVWNKSGESVTSATGKWTTNKNVQSAEQARDGKYSLYFTKKNGLTSPELKEGAGTLIYYAYDNNRQMTVETSKDNVKWTAIEQYKETSTWTKHAVEINDPEVRWVRFTLNSNNQFYIDNVLITKTDGTTGSGEQIKPALTVKYFVQDFENTNTYPQSKEAATTEQSFTVDGQGEWKYLNAYKNTNDTYIPDFSAHGLRMLKKTSYVITPILSQGVATVSFDSGRNGKKLKVYASKDAGSTWELVKEITSSTENTVTIEEKDVNRIKIANESSNDNDIDNIIVTGYPAGVPASVNTGGADHISSSSANVSGSLLNNGDKPVQEWGICWSAKETPDFLTDNIVKADAKDFTLTLTDLPARTKIYYTAYALSMAGVSYGEIKNFETLPTTTATVSTTEPVEDEAAMDEKNIFVRVGGQIADFGGEQPSEVGVCYSQKENPAIGDNKITGKLNGNEFSVSIPLNPLTTYYFRAYAINTAGTAYGEQKAFTTQALVVPDYAHNVYYVSPAGDDATADGSEEKPFYNLQLAVDKVTAGDTIYIKGGNYQYEKRINISAIGKKNSGRICLYAKDGRPVLDFSKMAVDGANQGIRLTGSYWHFYGIDICNAGDNGLLIERNKPTGGTYQDVKNRTEEGHDNIIELCNFYRCYDTGLQMKNLAENNLVINCDSYFNADVEYGNADGFAVKISHGDGNYFYGCRAWNNSDDGWDGFYKEPGFPDDMTTTLENCWAFKNGFLENDIECKGNGNGFKMGSNQGRNNMILNRCLAFDNLQKGFDQNHNTGNMILNNCTGYSAKYNNKSHYTYRLDEATAAGREIVMNNCVAISDGVSEVAKSAYAPYRIGPNVKLNSCNLNTLPEDYKSIDPAGMDGERDANGNLPVLDFMRIKDGNTKLIDKGIVVSSYKGESAAAIGIQYNGSAPDLGCFETEEATAIKPMLNAVSTTRQTIEVEKTVGGLCIITVPQAEEKSEYTLNVFDAAGRLIKAHNFYGKRTAVNLTKGQQFYILNVRGNNVHATLKIQL